MRAGYLLVTLAAALTLAAAVRALPVVAEHPGIRLLSVSAPSAAAPGETYAVYGGLELPEGTFDKRFVTCGPNGCTTRGWGAVSGPGDWWGSLGSFAAPTPGMYTAELVLYGQTAFGARPAVARYSWSVDVR